MVLWRLSGIRHANAFDGGYGLLFDGRWNTIGHAVTYCATSPSLCVLEKLVHVEDPALLPALVMVAYEGPDMIGSETIALADLPQDWRYQEGLTQHRGDAWHGAGSSPLLFVPSVIVPITDSPDTNVVVNHAHPAAAELRVRTMQPYRLDPRLF